MSSPKQQLFTLLVLLSLSHQALSSMPRILTEAQAVSAVVEERLIFEWTINDFDRIPAQTGQYLDSPLFRTKTKDFAFRLRMYAKGVDANAMGYTSVYLMRETDAQSNATDNIPVHCTFYIFKSQVLQAQTSFDYAYAPWTSHGRDKFVRRSMLLESYGEPGSPPFSITAEVDLPLRIVTELSNAKSQMYS